MMYLIIHRGLVGGSKLIQVIARCMFGANPLSEPMLPNHLDRSKQASVQFWSKFIPTSACEHVRSITAIFSPQSVRAVWHVC